MVRAKVVRISGIFRIPSHLAWNHAFPLPNPQGAAAGRRRSPRCSRAVCDRRASGCRGSPCPLCRLHAHCLRWAARTIGAIRWVGCAPFQLPQCGLCRCTGARHLGDAWGLWMWPAVATFGCRRLCGRPHVVGGVQRHNGIARVGTGTRHCVAACPSGEHLRPGFCVHPARHVAGVGAEGGRA